MKKAFVFAVSCIITLIIGVVVLLVKKKRCISFTVNRKEQYGGGEYYGGD